MGLWPTQGDENASVQQPLSMERRPFLCHPERSRGICSSADLSWKRRISSHDKFVISTGAYPDFLPRCTGNDRVCGFQ
jgi:hypothetical protein